MKKILVHIILLIIPFSVFSQVYLSGVMSNPVIKSYLIENDAIPFKTIIKDYESIFLPFEDDFSYTGVYPDTNLWIDNYTYINAEYPIYPVDYGVATLDVLDANGDLYNHANQYSFIADHLTSYPIRLDSVFDPAQGTLIEITPADSVYLSFYYQPQGWGDVPLPDDSLVLEFGNYSGDTVFSHMEYFWLYTNEGDSINPGDEIIYDGFGCDTNYILADRIYVYPDSILVPCDSVFVLETNWTPMWSALGEPVDTFMTNNDIFFKQVMIPITDTIWFEDDFQFRFYNMGSISDINSWQSNTDHWHIDKINLNVGRSVDDIFTREIRFVEPAESFIKEYYSMPLSQYNLDYWKDSIKVTANNIDSIYHKCTYYYQVQDEEGNYLPEFNYEGYTDTIEPFYTRDVSNYTPFAYPPVIRWFDFSNPEEVDYKISHYIYDEDSVTVGDTIVFNQQFKNHFAYDDGTAERSYGASTAGTRIAVQFRTAVSDTLRGVQIFFNKTFGDHSGKFFHLGVWNNNNGEPGLLIYKKENLQQEFSGLNEFHTYIFEDTLIKLGVVVFYIGVIQTTNENLNIGFDRNTDSRNRTFYNTSNQWNKSPYDGSLMIRPVVGKALIEPEPPVKSQPAQLEIYPNPPGSYDYITIDLPSDVSDPKYWKYLTIRIFDISGRLIYSSPFEEKFNISRFDNGFYLVDILDEAFSRNYTTKLLIVK
ncbi:MAG: T9SS type A sorting domain-containing protein [Bacteroidales bacterium]|nr:T9SS type A sorting domain-containing protein [Bacteroidales bacterium]